MLTPLQAPNANAHAERFVRPIREECLDRLILLGERRLLRALDEFVAPEELQRLTGCAPGAVPLFGRCSDLPVFVDETLTPLADPA